MPIDPNLLDLKQNPMTERDIFFMAIGMVATDPSAHLVMDEFARMTATFTALEIKRILEEQHARSLN